MFVNFFTNSTKVLFTCGWLFGIILSVRFLFLIRAARPNFHNFFMRIDLRLRTKSRKDKIFMINIGICFENDDENSFMRAELCGCFDLRGIDYNIYCCRCTEELRRIAQKRRFDLFFYDITGERGRIRKAALALKQLNPRLVSVIFNDSKYKPPLDDMLLEPLYTIPNRNRRLISKYAFLAYEAIFNKENTFSYYKRPSYVHIPIELIKYFSSEGRCTRINCANPEQEDVFYKKLGEVEDLMSSKECSFLRIHQSYLINAEYVSAFNRALVTLTTGEKLPISKYEYYKDICRRLAEKKVRKKYCRFV